MAQLDRATLKAFFESGDFPTEAQFSDFIDSVVNITDDSPPLTFSKSVTDTEIKAYNTTPIIVIPAQGANTITRPIVIQSKLTFVTTAYAIPGGSRVEYHETSLGGTLIASHNAGYLTAVADSNEAAGLEILPQVLLENVDLVVGNTVGDPTLGDGIIEIKVLATVQQF